jgi:hypothetical protein
MAAIASRASGTRHIHLDEGGRHAPDDLLDRFVHAHPKTLLGRSSTVISHRHGSRGAVTSAVAKARARARSPFVLSRWVIVGILAFALLAPVSALAAPGRSGRASVAAIAPGDRAATHTLLKAKYELAKATLASRPGVRAGPA